MTTEKRLIDANALSESVSGIGKDMKRPRAVELACLCLIAEAPPWMPWKWCTQSGL